MPRFTLEGRLSVDADSSAEALRALARYLERLAEGRDDGSLRKGSEFRLTSVNVEDAPLAKVIPIR